MSMETVSYEDAPWVPMLLATIIQNQAVRVEETGEDGVVVYVRQKRPSFLVPPISWIVPFSKERRFTLDSLGAKLWRLCDGNRTVEDIVEVFMVDYDLTFHESRVAVISYLKTLIQRGVLAIIMQDET